MAFNGSRRAIEVARDDRRRPSRRRANSESASAPARPGRYRSVGLGGGSISLLPRSTPSIAAVFAFAAGGVASHITTTTTTISINDRHEALPEEDGVAKRNQAAGTMPPAATMSRICGCSAPGVAICSAAEPLRPCAQMLPMPSMLAAASAR